ncbi:uncharacterized protein Dana_GF22413 [Drosophila ananassae]|uniref:Peptidase S1 domain-containing protein n=1 Tax=Drosophila ananassae TaxID=7217 RepID=B3MWP4_DROAN|nr:uncharacterized protein LOC6505074 [Drosophila ananassae]EDV35029.2 uncharacterized protein Dana_GF22413 [Drosophila ananassae]
MWRVFLILSGALGAFPTDSDLSLAEGQPCPQILNYPQSVCKRRCPQMRQFIDEKYVDHEIPCNFDSICCPTHSLQSGATSPSAGTSPVPLYPNVKSKPGQLEVLYNFSFPPLAELSYLSLDQDEHLYRCTALLVREDYVLTSAGCVGKDISEKPNGVCFGNCHRLDRQAREKILFEIIDVTKFRYNNDLALIRFENTFNSSEFPTICQQSDLEQAHRLIAVGFSQKEENCDLFQQNIEIMPFDFCKNLENNFKVEGIEGEVTHFCARPIKMTRNVPGDCVRCLRGSSSVLFAVQPDNGYCAVGIATPTISACYYTTAALYYTSLLNPNVTKFINQ